MNGTDAYDRLAEDYDALTGTERRRPATMRFVDRLLGDHPVRSVLDAACGNGLFALELARRGCRVSGFDLSAEMLARATAQARKENLDIDFERAPMQALEGILPGPFDAVLCMGNSLPHLLTEDDLRAACTAFAERLAPGGILAIAMLNYPKVLEDGDRIVGVTRKGDEVFVRFYDFGPEVWTFNILRISWDAEGKTRHALESMGMRPWSPAEVGDALTAAGLDSVSFRGGMDFGPFDPSGSDTVLVTGRAPSG